MYVYASLFPVAYLNESSAVTEMGDRLVTIVMGRKVGGGASVSLSLGELGPHLTQCRLGRGHTLVPSGILIHPTVWPQYTTVTERQDRQDWLVGV